MQDKITLRSITAFRSRAPELLKRAQASPKRAELAAKRAAEGRPPAPIVDLGFMWDTELRGFGAKLTAGGKVVYLAQYRLPGSTKTRRYTIGDHGSPWTPETAREEAKEALRLAERGKDPTRDKKAAGATHTLRDFWPTYYEKVRQHSDAKRKHKKPRTIEEEQRLMDNYLLPKLGSRKLSELSTEIIRDFHNQLVETPVAANRAVSLLSHILNIAMAAGDLPKGENPCRAVGRYEEKKRTRALSEPEMAQLGQAFKASGESKIAVGALMVILLTGARKSEIATLKRQWIDRKRGGAILPDSKTGEKFVALPPDAMRIIDALPEIEGNPYVFPGAKAKSHIVGVQKVWERIRKLAGLQDMRIHDLRHSFATTGIRNKESLALIGHALGHSRPETTQRYSHPGEAAALGVSTRIAKTISAALAGKKNTRHRKKARAKVPA